MSKTYNIVVIKHHGHLENNEIESNLKEKDTDKFLSLTRTKLENKNYKVYFSHARFTYKNANMMVQPNELIIAIKEE